MLDASLRKPVFRSIALAVFLHLLFVLLAMAIRMRGHFENPEELFHRFRVKAVRTEQKAASLAQAKRVLGTARPTLQFQSGKASVEDVSVHAMLSGATSPAGEKLDMPVDRPGSGSSQAAEGSNLRRLLSDVEENRLKDVVKPVSRRTDAFSPAAARARPSGPSAVNFGNLLETLKKPLAGSALYAPPNVALNPEEGMPGFTPSVAGTRSGAAESFLDARIGESPSSVTSYESLDDFLDIALYTYAHPGEPLRYFMVKIFPKKDAKLVRVMPKEVLFAIDCSLSISRDRLEEFKRGISYCLGHLNSGDLFNLVAFKDQAVFFSETSIPASPEVISRAERFVLGLEPSRRTDVYTAIRGIVEKPRRREPSNILLLSDGKPTYGVVDARDLLASITRVNRKDRPIFVFSGGAKVNRYLLDFIAYQNRAWSEFIRKMPDIDKGLASFYDKIRDPIFLHLRYRLHGVDEGAVYPKWLPDFYRNAEFTLYGRWEEDEETLSMQLLGDVEGKTKELVFQRSLREAQAGSADIRRGWAFNKIYHLINRVTIEGNRPELLGEIKDLSQAYEIQTPYSPELQKID